MNNNLEKLINAGMAAAVKLIVQLLTKSFKT